MNNCKSELWTGLYKQNYDLATYESMAHPAKGAWGLAFKIIEHLEEVGLLKSGDTLLDPMAGTGRFLLAGAARGYAGVGIELEPYFKDLVGDCHCDGITTSLSRRMLKGSANRTKLLSYIKTRICPICQVEVDKQRMKDGPRTIFTSSKHYYNGNIAYASEKLNRLLDITIIQGDSRNLSELLKKRELVAVTSPPFLDSTLTKDEKFISKMEEQHRHGSRFQGGNLDGYGNNPLNIGNLPAGSLIAVTSPPYEDSDMRKPGLHLQETVFKGSKVLPMLMDSTYGHSEGQIGKEHHESYQSSMLKVYSELIKVAKVLAVVVKNPTRKGKIYNLALDTFLLLKSCHNLLYCNCETHYNKESIELNNNEWEIYQTLVKQGETMLSMQYSIKQQIKDQESRIGWHIHCIHQAKLFKEVSKTDLFGQTTTKPKGRISFFKRLSYGKGNVVTDHESVIIAIKKE